MNKNISRIIFVFLLALSITACSGGGENSSDATEQPTATATPIPTEVPSPTPTEEPAVVDADVVGDVAIATAGETFVKTWRVRNTGDVDWESGTGDFNWVFVDGDRLDGPDAVPIIGTVAAGQVYEVTAEFTAPEMSGEYQISWQLQDPDGQPIGPVFTTSLIVEEAPIEVAEEEPEEETPEPGDETPEANPEETEPMEYEEGCLDSYPVSDVTIPDGTVLEPGETFTKIWRIRNTGTCAWDEADGEFTWRFIYGNRMEGPYRILLSGTVEPDGTYDVQIELTAPSTPGEYRGSWQLYDPNGDPFGVPFWVAIQVPGDESENATLPELLWFNINGTRSQTEGVTQLSYSVELARAAQLHAEDCAQRGECSHFGSDGADIPTRTARAGYSGSVDEAWALAVSPAEAVQSWMNDPVYRTLVLSNAYNEIGTGVAQTSSGYYFVAIFGRGGQ
jgi:hypothetical protein